MLDGLTAMPQEGTAPSCSGENNEARSGRGRRRKRVEERKRLGADKWDAEVAQFGEQEAIRRQDLEKYAARLEDELPTSDIEEMDIADERANPLLYIDAVLRVDRKPQWAHFVGRHHLWDVDVALMLEQPSGMSLKRTDRLLDQQEARREQARLSGNHDLDVMERWQYYNPYCSNQNGCCSVETLVGSYRI